MIFVITMSIYGSHDDAVLEKLGKCIEVPGMFCPCTEEER